MTGRRFIAEKKPTTKLDADLQRVAANAAHMYGSEHLALAKDSALSSVGSFAHQHLRKLDNDGAWIRQAVEDNWGGSVGVVDSIRAYRENAVMIYKHWMKHKCGDPKHWLSALRFWVETKLPPDEFRMHLAQEFAGMMQFASSGMPVFQPTPDLCAMLAFTDCGNVDLEDVRPPFDSFAVQLPSFDPYNPIWMREPKLGVLVPGTFVLFQRMFRPKTLTVGEMECASCDQEIITREVEEFWVFTAVSGKTGINIHHRANLSIAGTVKDMQRQALDLEERGVKELEGSWDLAKQDCRALAIVESMICNLCLYLGYKESPKLKRRKKPTRRYGRDYTIPVQTWIVGKEIKVGHEMKIAASEMRGRITGRKGWKLKTRCVVRGHWKKQFYGKGRAKRKLIFVRPYMKGPDVPQLAAHAFEVE